ncbi:MAG: recombinase family protein, partial [Candidatus Ancillula sp.]|nr:recombinase family protein [Candidatus Ancillula sp.]
MNTAETTTKYYLYARKSTDTEDRQVHSIDDQLAVLRDYAKQHNLNVVEEFVEKRSAKKPDNRPVFKQMVENIKSGQANSILAWNPDRLSRNPVDAAVISWMLTTGELVDLRFPTTMFSNDPNGHFMLNLGFAQSQQYIENLAINSRRGLIQKAKRKEYPVRAPFGYINDVRNKTLVEDKNITPHLKKAFEMYSTGGHSYIDISEFLFSRGVTTTLSKKKLQSATVKHILSNIFYTGLFNYAGEVYEGNYMPLITKELFKQCQVAMKGRSKVKAVDTKVKPAYGGGLIKCATCGMSIYSENRSKIQKNGNHNKWKYYRCSRSNKKHLCNEKFIRAEKLDGQISKLIASYTLPKHVADYIRTRATEDEIRGSETANKFLENAKPKLAGLKQKSDRLTEAYIDGLIDRAEFTERKQNIILERKQIEEQIERNRKGISYSPKPMLEWLEQAENLDKIAKSGSGEQKRTACLNLFYPNLSLCRASVRFSESKRVGKAGKQTAFSGQRRKKT